MSDELKRPGWELMRREADSSGKKYLFHFQHEDGREIAIEGRVENEAWFYLGLNTRAQPSDGALTNEGAEPVALADAFGEWFKRNPYEELTHATLGYMAFKAGAVWLSTQRPPAKASVVLPERRIVRDSETILQWHKDCEWNACIDRAKELNS